MPYIRQALREGVDFKVDHLNPITPGELNYLFSMIAKNYLENLGVSYQTCNDVLGALDGASKEFYRRVVVPYEDQKIKENGDVYNGIEQQAKKAGPPPQLRSEGVEL